MSGERRKHSRQKVRVPVVLRTEDGRAPLHAATTDLSLRGCYIEMMFTFEIGTQLDLALELGDTPVLAVGTVVTCDRTVGNGILFTDMLASDRKELEDFLKKTEVES